MIEINNFLLKNISSESVFIELGVEVNIKEEAGFHIFFLKIIFH